MEHSLHAFWHLCEYIADTLIFFVAGAVMATKAMGDTIDTHDWLNLLYVFFALQVSGRDADTIDIHMQLIKPPLRILRPPSEWTRC